MTRDITELLTGLYHAAQGAGVIMKRGLLSWDGASPRLGFPGSCGRCLSASSLNLGDRSALLVMLAEESY